MEGVGLENAGVGLGGCQWMKCVGWVSVVGVGLGGRGVGLVVSVEGVRRRGAEEVEGVGLENEGVDWGVSIVEGVGVEGVGLGCRWKELDGGVLRRWRELD